jgi:tRNA pseudouridine32 synthase/23S rRNA pseudouridine746 synthase
VPYVIFEFQKDHIVEILTKKTAKETEAFRIRRVQKLTLIRKVGAGDPATACEFLATFTPLSKGRIKDAIAKGTVWLKKSKGAQRRIRRANTTLKSGDRISIYYDGALLSLIPPPAELFSDQKRFSVWLKPAGLLSQGTKYSDHFDMIGHPVMGDPRYGKGNKNSAGLQLVATGLEFSCPFSKKKQVFKTAAGFYSTIDNSY